jgi:hypothetical protein
MKMHEDIWIYFSLAGDNLRNYKKRPIFTQAADHRNEPYLVATK